MPSLLARRSALARRSIPTTRSTRTRTARTSRLPPITQDVGSVQNVVAALSQAVIGGRGVELRKLGFEMLIDQEQRPHRTAQITVAARDDLVDRGVVRSQTHRNILRSNQNNPADRSRVRVDSVEDRRPSAQDDGTDHGDYMEGAMTTA